MTSAVAARTNRQDSGSSGIGLAICDAIVRQHCGKIEVEPGTGTGSKFTVTLPRREN
jgi:signal transduction histidine kinase